jgi:hypothetical protein
VNLLVVLVDLPLSHKNVVNCEILFGLLVESQVELALVSLKSLQNTRRPYESQSMKSRHREHKKHNEIHSGKRRIKTESSREILPLFILLNGDKIITTLIRDAAAMTKYWKIGQRVKIISENFLMFS